LLNLYSKELLKSAEKIFSIPKNTRSRLILRILWTSPLLWQTWSLGSTEEMFNQQLIEEELCAIQNGKSPVLQTLFEQQKSLPNRTIPSPSSMARNVTIQFDSVIEKFIYL